MVGDDALIFALAVKLHVAQLEGGGVLRDLTALCPHVRLVVDLGVVQILVVLLPGKSHGRVAGAGCRAHEGHIGALDG